MSLIASVRARVSCVVGAMSIAGQKKIRTGFVVGAYLLATMGLLRATFVDRRSEFDGAFGTILAIVVTMACVADSVVIGRPIVHGARFPFMAIWPAAAPIYILRSRGWWGVVVLFIHLAILLGVLVACAIARVLAPT